MPLSIAVSPESYFLCGTRGTNDIFNDHHVLRRESSSESEIHLDFVALGEDGAYFKRYVDDGDYEKKMYITYGLMHSYPDWLNDEKVQAALDEGVKFLSLGSNGHFFMRSSEGTTLWNLSQDAEDYVESQPWYDQVDYLWLGQHDTWVAQTALGSKKASLKGNYGTLADSVQIKESKIVALALNLSHNQNYYVLFADGERRGNETGSPLSMFDLNAWADELIKIKTQQLYARDHGRGHSYPFHSSDSLIKISLLDYISDTELDEEADVLPYNQTYVFTSSYSNGDIQSDRGRLVTSASGVLRNRNATTGSLRLYDPLAGETTFRLLTLHPATPKDSLIRCSLTIHDLQDHPNYTALSYVWGEPSPARQIIVNGHRVEVTPNLHSALERLQSKVAGVLWIDALCIDQSNIPERQQQVSVMSDIYVEAHHVVSWLGPPGPLSIYDSGNELKLDVSFRSYWTRAWIIQEFLLAKHIILVCGDKTLSQESDSYTSKLFPKWRYHSGPMDRLCALKEGYLQNPKGDTQTKPWHLFTLGQALAYATKFDATDPRDKVYAVLGLARKEELDRWGLYPDYSLGTCEVICRALRVMSAQADSERARRMMKTSLATHKHQPLESVESRHPRDDCDGGCGTLELMQSLALDWTALLKS